jgi:hypothetical protein
MAAWTDEELSQGLLDLKRAITDHLAEHQDQGYLAGHAFERRFRDLWERVQALRGRVQVLEGRLDALDRLLRTNTHPAGEVPAIGKAGGGSPSGAGRPGPVPPPAVSNPNETP